MMLGFGLGLRLRSRFNTLSSVAGGWSLQGRRFWEDITTNWEAWSSVVGTFKFWQEQTKNYWQNEATPTWDNWFTTYGSLIMFNELTTNWESLTTNWESL